MKTRRLSTILTSAYLSAMLASSVAPIRSDATLAATIDPSAARQALEHAVNSLDGAGWAAVAEVPAAAPAEPREMTYAARTTPSEPVMTPELMARLIKYTRNVQNNSTIDARICKVLNLCAGTEDMPLKVATSDVGENYFGLPLDANSKDIIFAVKNGTVVDAFLTNKTGILRAAAILENGSAHLITNEAAAEKYKKVLSVFAGEAASLPPTGGTSVASTEAGG